MVMKNAAGQLEIGELHSKTTYQHRSAKLQLGIGELVLQAVTGGVLVFYCASIESKQKEII